MQEIEFTTPVGQLVMGSLYEANKTDYNNQPLVYKRGANAGQPRVQYFFALAIPKVPGQPHWAYSEWGQKIWAAGHAFMANAGNMQGFRWKILDGDQPGVDEKGQQIPIRQGFKGCWVIRFAGSFAPALYNGINAPDPKNPPALNVANAIKLGDYVQVNAKAVGNGATGAQAGIYLNPRMVCLQGYGERIIVGPDVGTAGFGGAPLPPGASMTPVGGFAGPQPGMPAPGGPMIPSMPQPGMPQPGMPQPGMPQPGMPQPSMPGMPQPPGVPTPGYGPTGASPPAVPQTPVQPNFSYMHHPGMATPPGALPSAPGAAYPTPGAQPNAVQPYAPQQPGMPGVMPPGVMGQPAASAGYPAPLGAQMQPNNPQQMPGAYGAPQGYPQAPAQPGGMPPAAGYPSAMPAPMRQMLPAAQGVPYEVFIQRGWTDAQLVQGGYMAP